MLETTIAGKRAWEASGASKRPYPRPSNASRIDRVSLKCADSRVPPSLMGLLKDKGVMVGAVAVAPDRVETPEQVADTIRLAMRYVDAERLY